MSQAELAKLLEVDPSQVSRDASGTSTTASPSTAPPGSSTGLGEKLRLRFEIERKEPVTGRAPHP